MKLGVSTKSFLYQRAYDRSFDMRYKFVFTKEINIIEFEKAIKNAIVLYPEFRIRIKIENNKFVAEENNLYPLIFEENGKTYKYGAKEINYFLFYFTYNKNELHCNMYHGLTDYNGAMHFITTVFYNYLINLNTKFSEEEEIEIDKVVRKSINDYSKYDEEDILDPYNKYYNKVEVEDKNDLPKNIILPLKRYDSSINKIKLNMLELDVNVFLEMAKKYNTSFTPLLIYILSTVINNKYKEDGKKVVSMLPFDMRNNFNSKTTTNFSDSIIFVNDEDGTIEEKCKNNKNNIINQKSDTNVQKILQRKIKAIDIYENDNRNILDLVKSLCNIEKGYNSPFSYVLSYVGDMNFANGISKYIDSAYVCSYVNTDAVLASTYKNKLKLIFSHISDDCEFENLVYDEMKKMGISIFKKDLGYAKNNRLELESFIYE